VYRKPTHTDRLLDQSSYNPTSHKATTIKTLTRRAQLVCDTPDSLSDENKYLERVFHKNNCNYGKPIVAIFNNLIYIQFKIYIYVIFFSLFNLIFIFINFVFLFIQFNIYIYGIFLNSFNLTCLYLFNLIALYSFNLIRIYSFNSIRQYIHLILGTGSSHRIRKRKAWERIIANTIWRTSVKWG
jgi:hypothetical protein